MSKCIICGDETSQPFAAAVEHFRPFEWHDPRFILGNIRAFGLWSGFRGSVNLFFPFVNTLWNWKYRKMRLFVDEQPEGEGPGVLSNAETKRK